MAISIIKAVFPCEVERVWEKVTALDNCTWRSDLSRIEILDENRFVEYTKNGYATSFTVTVFERCQRWEFDMENDNIKGHWSGVFTRKDGQTEIEFTENVTAKKLFMKPFVKVYLKKQQSQYVADLKKALQ